MQNINNIGDFIIMVADFLGDLAQLLESILFYQIPIEINGSYAYVYQLLFVLGAVGVVAILILKAVID